jgi:hypothetical protein
MGVQPVAPIENVPEIMLVFHINRENVWNSGVLVVKTVYCICI